MKKSNTELFIEKAKKVHGNKYIYDKTVYTRAKDKIIFTCPQHDDLTMTANNHLNGKGCYDCWLISNTKTLDEFINQANKVHNNIFDYSLNKSYKYNQKLTIICPLKHVFTQLPSRHLQGAGCTFCRSRKISESTKETTEDFIEKARKIHGDKYDYSMSDYTGAPYKLIIICKIHGKFDQQAGGHLLGKGCRKCADEKYKLSTKEFIEHSSKIHNNKYTYEKSIYDGHDKKCIITCPIHGEFSQMAGSHMSGAGCQRCHIFSSGPENRWLDLLLIPKDFRSKTLKIGDKRYNVDAFDPNTNIIYEFYGDYWHGNPSIYDRNKINKSISGQKTTFGILFDKTINRQKELEVAGYNVIFIWENDFKKYDTYLKQKTKKVKNKNDQETR